MYVVCRFDLYVVCRFDLYVLFRFDLNVVCRFDLDRQVGVASIYQFCTMRAETNKQVQYCNYHDNCRHINVDNHRIDYHDNHRDNYREN